MKFNWKKEIRLAQRWLKRNGSTVSSLAASLGVIATGYFGWKAHDDYTMCSIDPTPEEAVKIFWKPAVSATGTIADTAGFQNIFPASSGVGSIEHIV